MKPLSTAHALALFALIAALAALAAFIMPTH
jgi:hypothetical protein